MIARDRHVHAVHRLLAQAPVVAILGARQVGKTTLARIVARDKREVHWFDLENPRHLASLADPMGVLEPLRGLVVIDEVHWRPDLFAPLRVLVDRPRSARFLLLGSASPQLLRQGSESLAGRVAFHELGGFALDEVGAERWPRLWLRGGFPRSFLARSDADSAARRRDFLRTFFERDAAQLGLGVPAATLQRFWSMLAHWHGQVWNAAEFGRAFGLSDASVRRYLDSLAATFLVRRLAPWHANLAKRQIKSPKIYLADSGHLHATLDISSRRDLLGHPKVGASWEGFGIAALVERLGASANECFFWATHAGAELDLLVVRGRQRRGFELKHTESPTVTPSMRVALADLGLESIDVIYPGSSTFPLGPSIRAVGIERLLSDVQQLR